MPVARYRDCTSGPFELRSRPTGALELESTPCPFATVASLSMQRPVGSPAPRPGWDEHGSRRPPARPGSRLAKMSRPSIASRLGPGRACTPRRQRNAKAPCEGRARAVPHEHGRSIRPRATAAPAADTRAREAVKALAACARACILQVSRGRAHRRPPTPPHTKPTRRQRRRGKATLGLGPSGTRVDSTHTRLCGPCPAGLRAADTGRP